MTEFVQKLKASLWPLDQPQREIPVDGYRPPGVAQADHSPRQAAVLVPIIPRSSGFTVLFTQRSAWLNAHAGQVSFPGGGLEPEDDSHIRGALRETQEEIGVDPDLIAPMGLLNFFDTVTNYRVLPVVGLMDASASFVLDENEVDSVFEVAFDRLMDISQYQEHRKSFQGREHIYYSYRHGEYIIWGATAAMLLSLRKRMMAAYA